MVFSDDGVNAFSASEMTEARRNRRIVFGEIRLAAYDTFECLDCILIAFLMEQRNRQDA